MSQTSCLQQASSAAPADAGMAELFPELHGLLAREALRDEGDSLEAWQRLRLVNKAWHDGLQGEAHSSVGGLPADRPEAHQSGWPCAIEALNCSQAGQTADWSASIMAVSGKPGRR